MISVIIPYNKDRGFLQSAIDSVNGQLGVDFEIIKSFSDNTLGYNINRGVEKAKGEYIKILAEDDLLNGKCALFDLQKGIEFTLLYYDFVCSDATNKIEFIQSENVFFQYTGRKPDLKGMLERNQIHGGTTLYRKSLFDELGGFDESLTTAEEYDFNLKLLYNGKTCNYIPNTTYIYRIHAGGKGSQLASDPERKKYIKDVICSRYR